MIVHINQLKLVLYRNLKVLSNVDKGPSLTKTHQYI